MRVFFGTAIVASLTPVRIDALASNRCWLAAAIGNASLHHAAAKQVIIVVSKSLTEEVL